MFSLLFFESLVYFSLAVVIIGITSLIIFWLIDLKNKKIW